MSVTVDGSEKQEVVQVLFALHKGFDTVSKFSMIFSLPMFIPILG
jgi:hypothetical protein